MSEFLFRGEAERPAWSGYWWPMFISADRPAYRNLDDDDGPRDKYDRFCGALRLPSPRAKEFERWRYWSDTRMEQATGDKASPRSGAWTGASQNDLSDLPWRPQPLAVQNAPRSASRAAARRASTRRCARRSTASSPARTSCRVSSGAKSSRAGLAPVDKVTIRALGRAPIPCRTRPMGRGSQAWADYTVGSPRGNLRGMFLIAQLELVYAELCDFGHKEAL